MRADNNVTGRQCRNGEQIRRGRRGVEHVNIKCEMRAKVHREHLLAIEDLSFLQHLFHSRVMVATPNIFITAKMCKVLKERLEK